MSRLVWHRRDLRLRDNELYHRGTRKIYSLFVFDPTDFSPRPTGIPDGEGGQLLGVTNGPHFSRRLLEAVHSLRHSLQSLGGELLVRTGDPLEVIPQLAQALKVEEVAWSEIPVRECDQSERLKGLLREGTHRCNVYTTCSATLAHPDSLPRDRTTWQRLARPKEKRKKRQPKHNATGDNTMPASIDDNPDITNVSPSRFAGMPTVMGDFRRVARTSAPVRELFGEPDPRHIANAQDMQCMHDIDTGDIPSLEELTRPLLNAPTPLLGCLPKELIALIAQSANDIPRSTTAYTEEQSLEHLRNFVLNHAATADRSLCDVSDNNSSKLSTPLTLGVLSPQQVYHCVKEQQSKLEAQHANNTDGESPADINWVISHMEMRDYFLFYAFRNGRAAYNLHPTTPAHKPNAPRIWLPLSANKDKFIRWATGRTNLPLVDAGMKELITTGYTSNRVRQNMASVLTKDLQLDWRIGAEYFQLCLEDHCDASNFGNWAYFAGVGCDPKSRHFRTVSQAWRYDSDGRYMKKWIDAFRDANEIEAMLRPWDFHQGWGTPIVPPETQLTWQDRERLEKEGRISDATK